MVNDSQVYIALSIALLASIFAIQLGITLYN